MPSETQQANTVSETNAADLARFAEQQQAADQVSEVLDEVPPLVQRGAIYLIGAALLVTLAILWFGKAHQVVTVQGQILPVGEAVQVVAMADGAVTQILAEAGDHLPAGAPILRFSHRKSELDLADKQRKQRLQAEKLAADREAADLTVSILGDTRQFLESGVDVQAPGDTMQAISDLKRAWLGLRKAGKMQSQDFIEKMRLMQREIELAEQNIALKEKNLVLAKEALEQQRQDLKIKRQRYDEFLKLADRGFYSRVDVDNEAERYRSAARAIKEKEKELDEMRLDISNDRLSLAEKKVQMKSEQANSSEQYRSAQVEYDQQVVALRQHHKDLEKKIEELTAEMATSRAEIELMQSQLARGTVVMPVDGTITQMQVNTPGQQIGTGTAVAVVVADSENLMVKATAKSKDVGFITPGMPARIKVAAFPFQQFGTVPGRVTKVFPNIGKDANFTVYLSLSGNKIKTDDRELTIGPGLTVKADLLTRKQRLISLLMAKDGKGKKDKDNQ